MDDQFKYFKIAKHLNEKHKKRLQKSKAHFRGNLNSFSLISLNKKTPEIGLSKLKKASDIEVVFEKFEDKLKNPPGRITPEKELQSWIINYANNNGGFLPFGDKIRFLTSELVWSGKEGRKIVNDILGINKKNDLVIIELKTRRLLTELCNQVNDFFVIVDDVANKDFFEGLVNTIMEEKWSGNAMKMIIWPFHENSSLGSLKRKGIKAKEVCYLTGKDGNSIDYSIEGNIQFKEFD